MLDDPAQDRAHKAQPNGLEPVNGSDDMEASEPPLASLADDVSALIEDGKTYVQAELAYQKTRVGFAGKKTKQGIIFGLGALAFLHLALIGLVVGLILALAPYLTAFGAVAVVVGALLIGVGLFAWLAVNRFKAIGGAFQSDDDVQA